MAGGAQEHGSEGGGCGRRGSLTAGIVAFAACPFDEISGILPIEKFTNILGESIVTSIAPNDLTLGWAAPSLASDIFNFVLLFFCIFFVGEGVWTVQTHRSFHSQRNTLCKSWEDGEESNREAYIFLDKLREFLLS